VQKTSEARKTDTQQSEEEKVWENCSIQKCERQRVISEKSEEKIENYRKSRKGQSTWHFKLHLQQRQSVYDLVLNEFSKISKNITIKHLFCKQI